ISLLVFFFFFSSRRRHTRYWRDWSSDVCSSDLIRHIMASGALPPALSAVRIDGELYWDGGILSNTPVEAVFDDNPRRSGLVFTVNIWNPSGPEPADMASVLRPQKDLQYASRAKAQVARQKQIHPLRHVIPELA